jgi:peptidoglycan-N-acetylglucosamine deacetylase
MSTAPIAARRTWQPSPAIWASVALHGAAGAATIASPVLWPWALGAVALNHAGLTAAGLLPRTHILGPNITRLNADAVRANQIALSFDDGPNPAITPWVLDQLDAANAKASFFCVGAKVRAHASLAREIVARGHTIENHSDVHSHAFSFFGLRKLERDIAAAQATIADVTGRAPLLFRAPAGLRSPLLEPALARLGLTLCAWTRRGFDTVERDPARVLARLCANLHAGDILLLHDGETAAGEGDTRIIHHVLPQLFAEFASRKMQLIPIHQAAEIR